MELRNTFATEDDVVVIYVVADNQWNEKSTLFVDGLGMRDRMIFAVDPSSKAIDQLGLRRENAEEMEAGVPHPATYLLDREGIVRFIDAREDFHIWVDSDFVLEALTAIP